MRKTTLILTLTLVLVPFLLGGYGLRSRVHRLEKHVRHLKLELEKKEEVLQFIHVVDEELNGLRGPHLIIEGANVHFRSGSGNSFDGCGPNSADFPNCESLTGLGNLIVGYNERRIVRINPREIRTGSHNLVIGSLHSYSSSGGLVVGHSNAITGSSASVCGGTDNEAQGWFASVTGGHRNLAAGEASSVSGGQDRIAERDFNWAAGGLLEQD